MSTRTTAPSVECPSCGHKFHEGSYFEMNEGSELQCPACEAELVVSEVEMVMTWAITTKAAYEAHEAKTAQERQKQIEWLRRATQDRKTKEHEGE